MDWIINQIHHHQDHRLSLLFNPETPPKTSVTIWRRFYKISGPQHSQARQFPNSMDKMEITGKLERFLQTIYVGNHSPSWIIQEDKSGTTISIQWNREITHRGECQAKVRPLMNTANSGKMRKHKSPSTLRRDRLRYETFINKEKTETVNTEVPSVKTDPGINFIKPESLASSHTQTDLNYFTDVSTSTSTKEIQDNLIKKATLASIYTQTELKHLTDVSTNTNTTVIRETSAHTSQNKCYRSVSSLNKIMHILKCFNKVSG